ncbi:DUF3397 domain-containing protein [Oceanobacillus kapialis]|uniref:DUF3397 domain-containing protein n=1 Tax=Oceanobacillus kapialis TaxID=481353 RepID=A0ABW5PYJ7_9BACI
MAHIVSVLIVAPFLVTGLIYFIARKLYRHNRKAFHTAVNISTPFYMIAVVILLSQLFHVEVTGYLFILLLVMMMVIIFFQWKYNTEILFRKAFKLLWRICFLLFVFLYFVLIVYGIVYRIFFY